MIAGRAGHKTLSTNSVALVVSFEFILLYSIIDYKKFNTSSKGKKVAAPQLIATSKAFDKHS